MSQSGRSRGGKLGLEEPSSGTPHKYHDTIDALREDVTRRQVGMLPRGVFVDCLLTMLGSQRAHIREQRDAQTKIQTLQQEIDKVGGSIPD